MPFLHERKNRQPWYRHIEEQTFRTGLRHKIFSPEGKYYKGDWVKGYQCGKGVELLPSGLQYEGDWLCNKKHGFGVRSQYDKNEKIFNLIYIGDYKSNKKHGYGWNHYQDGTIFEGEFQNNKRHGFGRCWYSNCSYYEGYWINDLHDGYGMLVQANGNRYEGQWRNGKKDGWGTFFHLDSGQKQVGFWEMEICVSSTMEDIKYRQSAVNPTPYPIQKLELDKNANILFFLSKADKMIFQFNDGCQLHKYCYKIPSKTEIELRHKNENPTNEIGVNE